MVSQTERNTEQYQNRLIEIITKASREAAKYTMKNASLESIINDGEERVGEYITAIKGIHLRGTSGAFRLCKKEKSVDEEIKEAQQIQGLQSWNKKICPNCQSENIEFCTVCYAKALSEIQRVREKMGQ